MWQVLHEATGRPALAAGYLCLQEPRAPSSSTRLRPGKSRPDPAPRRALPSGSVGRPPLWTSSSRTPHQSLLGYVCTMFNVLLCKTHVLVCCCLRFSCSCVHQNASSCRCTHDSFVFCATFGVHNLCLCMFWITLADQSSSNIQCELIRVTGCHLHPACFPLGEMCVHVCLQIERMTLEAEHTEDPTVAPVDHHPPSQTPPAWRGHPVQMQLPPKTGPVKVTLSGVPLVKGFFIMTGCRMTFLGVTWLQHWSHKPLTFGMLSLYRKDALCHLLSLYDSPNIAM